MPATPAWPPQSAPRLFIDQSLEEGASIALDGAPAHYLLSVMRVKDGDIVKLFDDRTGEWAAEALDVRKRDLTLAVTRQLRPREEVPDLWLCVAPVKKGRIDWVMEKACELGADRIRPVLTRRSVVDKLNAERLRAHLVEAAEQCGRTALPALDPLEKLDALLRDWPADRQLFFADEEGGVPFAQALSEHQGSAAILIGPEGGFDAEERAAIRALPQAIGISLGPRILRAETAAVAALSVWMANVGDW